MQTFPVSSVVITSLASYAGGLGFCTHWDNKSTETLPAKLYYSRAWQNICILFILLTILHNIETRLLK